jgi:hypothetical protein
MSAFDYLAVLLSIVLGLGITQVLAGFAGMVRARGWNTPQECRAGVLAPVTIVC